MSLVPVSSFIASDVLFEFKPDCCLVLLISRNGILDGTMLLESRLDEPSRDLMKLGRLFESLENVERTKGIFERSGRRTGADAQI
jgi:hypothetical protein